MTTSALNVTGPTTTVDADASSARSARAPRHRTTFLDWLGTQIETGRGASPGGNRPGETLVANGTGVGTFPDRGSFRSRGNTPPPIPDESAPGFERSTSRMAPHLIRYAEVPDGVKFPNGPYLQAPPENGGEWWLVNPFTGPEPWLRLEQIQKGPTEEVLPEGFADIFGPRPTRNEYPDYFELRLAKMEWEHDLEGFKQAGIPEGLDPLQLEAAKDAFLE